MKNLFSPLRLRDLTIKNRIALSPMQQYSASKGIPGQWHLVHLGSRAVGGAGLILTECTAVSPEAMCTPYDTGIWNKEQVTAWKSIVDFVHQQNAKIGVQLWHAGGKASSTHPNDGMRPLSIQDGGWIPKSSSATPINAHRPQAMTLQEIQEVKLQFVQAAKNAVDAGFDTIELHAAHGYLLHQFYSGLINKRQDEYGGSFENRIKLLVEIVSAVSDAPGAWTLEDSLKLSEILKDSGVDLITASGGGFVQVDPTIVKPGYQLPLATAIRQATNIPVGTVGMITDTRQANDIIERNDADLVVIAREHLRNPYFAIHSAMELGQATDIPWQYKRAY